MTRLDPYDRPLTPHQAATLDEILRLIVRTQELAEWRRAAGLAITHKRRSHVDTS